MCVCVQESVEDMGLYEDVSAAGTSVQVTVTHSGYSIIVLIFCNIFFSMLCPPSVFYALLFYSVTRTNLLRLK